jgi:hypothetical protein
MNRELNRFFFTLGLLFTFLYVSSQSKVVYAKSFVKQNKILLRWVPSDKKVFEIAIKNGYKITRYTNEENVLSRPPVQTVTIIPYPFQDSLKWAMLIKNNESAILAYKVIHASKKKTTTPQEVTNEKMFYDLFLLSCDFDSDIAKASGLFFTDSTISNSKKYSYKIEINNLPPTLKYAATNLEVNASVLSQNPTIKNLSAKFKRKTVKLKWKSVDYKNDFSAYNVERSLDSINYVRINPSPVILISSQFEKKKEFIYYDDTLSRTGTKYFYRIKGINHFGEEANPSNVVSGFGYEPINSFPIIDSIKVIQNQKVFLQYRMQDKKENSKPKEYILVRSKKDKGPYTKIFSSKEPANFIDEKPESNNYYKVGAITFDDDTLYSYSHLALISDTIPPIPPTGLKATVDAKGNVTITWDKNPEPDVQGYKVLKSNALHEEFVQINNEFAREPIYKDKLNLKTLTKTIFYSVVATDKRYNNSFKCKPIEVKRPDTIPPVKPIVTNLELKSNGINVNWINSNSEDVKYYVLYRNKELETKDTKIKEWQARDSLKSFLDTTVELGMGYKYRLLVSDEDDNYSISNNPYIKFETGYRKKITDIKFEVDRTLKTVKLKWNYGSGEIEKYVLYRCKQGAQPTIIKTFPGKVSEFTDKTLSIGNIYEYRIKPVYTNGAEGIISDAVIVEY